jgi:hypothetical protein
MEVQRRDFPVVIWLVKGERRVREGVENELLPRESAAKRRKAAQVHILTTP